MASDYASAGRMRGQKVRYSDGAGCCIWRTFPGNDDKTGLAFDFYVEDLDDLISVLQQLKAAYAVDCDDTLDAAW